MLVFFFKQKTAYEMRISDWSSDVCSSDLADHHAGIDLLAGADEEETALLQVPQRIGDRLALLGRDEGAGAARRDRALVGRPVVEQADRKSTRLNSVTNAHLVCRLLLEKKKRSTNRIKHKATNSAIMIYCKVTTPHTN